LARRLRQRRDTHVDAALSQISSRDIAVATIVARPAQDQRRQWPREAIGRFRERRPGALHQLFDARPSGNRGLLGGAHGLGSKDWAAHGHGLRL